MEWHGYSAVQAARNDYLEHHGVKGQKWGVRRYQNKDGSLTEKGQARLQKLNKRGAIALRSGLAGAIGAVGGTLIGQPHLGMAAAMGTSYGYKKELERLKSAPNAKASKRDIDKVDKQLRKLITKADNKRYTNIQGGVLGGAFDALFNQSLTSDREIRNPFHRKEDLPVAALYETIENKLITVGRTRKKMKDVTYNDLKEFKKQNDEFRKAMDSVSKYLSGNKRQVYATYGKRKDYTKLNSAVNGVINNSKALKEVGWK